MPGATKRVRPGTGPARSPQELERAFVTHTRYALKHLLLAAEVYFVRVLANITVSIYRTAVDAQKSSKVGAKKRA